MELKIATLNLCLGLKYKKLMVEQLMNSNKIDILCLQEVDLEFGFNENLLSIPGYDLLVEKNSIKARLTTLECPTSKILCVLKSPILNNVL